MVLDRVLNRGHQLLTGYPRTEKHVVFGRTLYISRGIVREKPDKDDAWLFACARHAESVVDVGCNVGQASVHMLLAGSVKRIVLVDANAQALALAARNIIANRLSMASTFVHAFASNEADTDVTFWTVGTGAAGRRYASHAQTASAAGAHSQVKTVTLDQLCAELCLQPDLVKVDVEGAESEVLDGSVVCAKGQKTRFFVEMHSNPDLSMTENAGRILGWCATTGYSAWYLTEHVQLTSPEQIAHRGRCHLLLQPADWPFPDWLRTIEQSDPVAYDGL